jgi:transcriptional regulator with XRE-family HTH domain
VSSFAERLNQAMHKKACKAVDMTKATGVIASVISRYRSGQHQPTINNVFAIAKYLKVSPEWLLNGSDAPEWTKPSQGTLWDKDKIIGVQEELIKNLQKQVGDLERQVKYVKNRWTDEVQNLKAQVDMLKAQNDQWKASSKDRHAKGREKPYAKEWEERKEKKRWEKAREKAKKPKSKKSKE